MKEIHAYKNDDGTYKLKCIVDTHVGGKLIEAEVVYERAKLTIEALPGLSSGILCELVVEDGACK